MHPADAPAALFSDAATPLRPLLALLQLASPALPVGGYAYSQGLEKAIEDGVVCDAATAGRWIGDLLSLSLARWEAPLWLRAFDAAAAGDGARLAHWNAELLAARETAELRAETQQMGASLLRALPALGVAVPPLSPAVPSAAQSVAISVAESVAGSAAEPAADAAAKSAAQSAAGSAAQSAAGSAAQSAAGSAAQSCAPPVADAATHAATYPAVFAGACAALGIGRDAGLAAYLWSWAENQVLVAVKSVPLGQQAGQALLFSLHAPIAAAVAHAAALRDDELGSAAIALALTSARHESQYSRLFRS